MIWVPSPSGYLDSIRLLDDELLQESAVDAAAAIHGLLGIESRASSESIDLWNGRAGALVVYAVWTQIELRQRDIRVADATGGLGGLAEVQYRTPRYRQRADRGNPPGAIRAGHPGPSPAANEEIGC